ncbi:hypothetical protein HYC85_029208 [Camellia sinensis]|uniref:Uncharacterized protein n=1 Tax=Camellia sinensis TaxID=4442 RepID=A0A7J7FY10_CAMSI|nr:hypothetical protein HYC85_029208 [Camellia sinensis]
MKFQSVQNVRNVRVNANRTTKWRLETQESEESKEENDLEGEGEKFRARGSEENRARSPILKDSWPNDLTTTIQGLFAGRPHSLPARYCMYGSFEVGATKQTAQSSALSKMGRLWALTFTPVIVMTFEFCQRGATVDTPFLTVLKTWTSPLEHLVITLVCVRLEFPEVSVARLASGSLDSTVLCLALHQTLVFCLGGAGNAL